MKLITAIIKPFKLDEVKEALQAAGVYGVQALLILYMANFLFTPDQLASVGGFDAWRGLLESLFGPMSLQALATQMMGLYLGLFFLTPLLGGWLGDRHWGPRLTCILGAVLATTGMVMVVIPATFLPGLLACAFGSGALRSASVRCRWASCSFSWAISRWCTASRRFISINSAAPVITIPGRCSMAIPLCIAPL